MTVYVDQIIRYPSGLWCHMWTDGTDIELDTFAAKIGLSYSRSDVSYGRRAGRFYHYDLRPRDREIALRYGAKTMSLRTWIRSRQQG